MIIVWAHKTQAAVWSRRASVDQAWWVWQNRSLELSDGEWEWGRCLSLREGRHSAARRAVGRQRTATGNSSNETSPPPHFKGFNRNRSFVPLSIDFNLLYSSIFIRLVKWLPRCPNWNILDEIGWRRQPSAQLKMTLWLPGEQSGWGGGWLGRVCGTSHRDDAAGALDCIIKIRHFVGFFIRYFVGLTC